MAENSLSQQEDPKKAEIDLEDQATTESTSNVDNIVEATAAPITKSHKTKPFVYVVSMTAALGALVFGYALTGAGGTFVMEGFREHFGLPDDSVPSNVESLITSLMSVGAIFGAVMTPKFLDYVGRKWVIFLAALIFSVGAAIQASAPVLTALYVGRFVGGCGIGMLTTSIPVYIAECAPTHARGKMVTFWQVGVTVGMLIGTGVNVGAARLSWGWRLSYGGNILFAAALMVAMATFMPESPRFLAAREAEDETIRQRLVEALHKLRHEEDIGHSLEAIETEIQEERELGIPSWSEVFRKKDRLRYRVLLGIAMQFLNQLSGNESINFYAPVILKNIFGSQSLFNSFLLGVVNLVAVIVTLFTVDRFGRVRLWILGGVVMLLAQIANSVLQTLPPTTATNNGFLAGLSIFTFAYHSTMGPLAWDICAEMFPVRERGKAVGLTTMANFVGVVIVGAAFSFALEASPSGCFVFFTVMLFLNTGLVYLFLPETAERSPLQIEEQFRAHQPKLARKIF